MEVDSRLVMFVVKEHSSLANSPMQSGHENEGSAGSSPHASAPQRCVLLRDVIDALFLKLVAARKPPAALPSRDRWQSTKRCAMKFSHSSRKTILPVKMQKFDA
ncbi:MAG TPA: hypothetical protein VN644_23110 [Pyrinomonadaceae bacterium]|nr:hypothetical protein [Pyrinomonadaceae bacterium]